MNLFLFYLVNHIGNCLRGGCSSFTRTALTLLLSLSRSPLRLMRILTLPNPVNVR
jgi:hypothetical protein